MAAWSGGSHKSTWHDRAWVRAEMAAWDEKYAALSPAARRAFVEDVRAAARPESSPPTTSVSKLPSGTVQELITAGLVEAECGPRGAEAVIVPARAYGFAARLRALKRHRLLRESSKGSLRDYASHVFDSYWLRQYLAEVVEKAIGQCVLYKGGDVLEVFVPRAAWPDWVAEWLKSPLARRVLEAIEQAEGQLPITEVARRVADAGPVEVRVAIDRLVTYLALVEDLHPETYEVMVGMLPAVRAARMRRTLPVGLPDPVPPVEEAPEGGLEVPDLRALLLELVSQPARLRQDGAVFAKELPRLAATLAALPGWLDEQATTESRVDHMLHRAGRLGLVQRGETSEGEWLEVSPAGREWLTDAPEQQYAAVYRAFRTSSRDPFSVGDHQFLGSTVFAVPAGRRRGMNYEYYYAPSDEERQPLRRALLRALITLPEGVYYPVGPLLDYLARGPHNPLWLETTPDKVRVWYEERPVAPMEDVLEGAARDLLGDLIISRLGPLGAMRLGQDANGQLLIARHRRLAAYFGEAVVEAPIGPTRVVVQPDFTVMVIGPGARPAVELAPFCDRARGQTGAAVTFKLTRESVVRALASGLAPDEVMARLEKHASTGVPANVRVQVQSWLGRVRTVQASTVELLRCPDADTARRVMEVLGKKAEAVGEAVVVLPGGALTGALRQKLRGAGLLVTDRED